MSAVERTAVSEPWKPQWAQHAGWIGASYTPLLRDPADPAIVEEPQHVVCDCSACGGHYQIDCATGNARFHIQNFCKAHLRCGEKTT